MKKLLLLLIISLFLFNCSKPEAKIDPEKITLVSAWRGTAISSQRQSFVIYINRFSNNTADGAAVNVSNNDALIGTMTNSALYLEHNPNTSGSFDSTPTFKGVTFTDTKITGTWVWAYYNWSGTFEINKY